MTATHARRRSIRKPTGPLFAGMRVCLKLARSQAAARTAACLVVALALAEPAYPQSAGASGNWAAKSPLSAPRNEEVAAAVNDRISVLVGSVSGNWRLTRNEEYDPATDKWRSRAPLPSGASHMAAAVLNGKIYAIGG